MAHTAHLYHLLPLGFGVGRGGSRVKEGEGGLLNLQDPYESGDKIQIHQLAKTNSNWLAHVAKTKFIHQLCDGSWKNR